MLRELPNPKQLGSDTYPESTQVFDRNGKLLYEFYGDKRRIEIKLDDVPKNLINATIAIEDANFYKHNGFYIANFLTFVKSFLRISKMNIIKERGLYHEYKDRNFIYRRRSLFRRNCRQ
ncbi:MAG: transglycosylase domain-containing protein [Desulfobacterales bacterium]|nr:transglycosylase domain-containing protein [Desulfobacterales bacterium]